MAPVEKAKKVAKSAKKGKKTPVNSYLKGGILRYSKAQVNIAGNGGEMASERSDASAWECGTAWSTYSAPTPREYLRSDIDLALFRSAGIFPALSFKFVLVSLIESSIFCLRKCM